MKRKLIEWADKYEVEGFIANDPVQFPRKHIGKRAEISGFITSWLSFGNRKAIIKVAEWLDKDFCDDPYCWLMTKQYNFYYNDAKIGTLAEWSVSGADALIAELKKGGME